MTDNYNDDSYSGRVRQTAVEILFELELSPQPLEKDNVKDELEHNMDEFEPEIYNDAIKSLHAAGYVESFSGVRDSDQGYERWLRRPERSAPKETERRVGIYLRSAFVASGCRARPG